MQRGYTGNGADWRAAANANPLPPQILDAEVDQDVLEIKSRRFTAAPITIVVRGTTGT